MKRLLFVCLGNICRSPAAEGVMKTLVSRKNKSGEYHIASAGTSGWHIGEPADGRMRNAASRRKYQLTSTAQQFETADFERYDLIIAMDDENVRNLKSFDSSGKYHHKIVKMTDFCRSCQEKEVPDPYYGGANGFEHVLNILEDACAGLYNHLENIE